MADNALPDQIVESIAIVNAKCLGEQPAIASNLALANQVFNTNMQQMMMMSQSQAMSQIAMATMAKCVAMLTNGNVESEHSARHLSDDLQRMLSSITKEKTGQKPVETQPGPQEEKTVSEEFPSGA